MKVPIPMVTLQPTDDPLYKWSYGSVRAGIPVREYTTNKNVIFVQPSHGAHFGFYEGSLLAAFSNTTSYTYPGTLWHSFDPILLMF